MSYLILKLLWLFLDCWHASNMIKSLPFPSWELWLDFWFEDRISCFSDLESRKHLLHIHDQKWTPDGLKVEIIISGGRADLNVKAKNHRAAELKHENWHEHRQLLEALYYCLIQQPFVENLVFLVWKQLCVSNLAFAFIINSIPVIFTKPSNITCIYPGFWISVSEAFC